MGRRFSTAVICVICGQQSARSAPSQKYCASCKEEAYREGNRANEERKRRAAGIAPVHTEFVCIRCSARFIRSNPSQRRCVECADIVAREVLRASRRRFEKANPRKRNSPADVARRFRYKTKYPESHRQASRRYNERNRDPINEKARARNNTTKRIVWRRHWESRRRKSDPAFVLNERMKNGVRRALRFGKGGRAWCCLVGYSLADLRRHIERQFAPGMSWGNIERWHLDHRVPLKMFRFTSVEDPEFRAAWALTNLQPLWGPDNLSKNAKRLYLL